MSALIGHATWNNATSLSSVSLSETTSIEALPAAIYNTHDVLQTVLPVTSLQGVDRLNGNATHTAGMVTITSTFPAPTTTSTLSLSSRSSRSVDCKDDVMARYMYDVAAVFQDIFGSTTEQRGQADNNSETASSSGHTSINNTVGPTKVSMAVIDFPRGSIVFLNTTRPNYLLIDHANATVAVWTEPANASTKATQTNLLDKLNTVLPYIEACGIVAIVWEIGKFVHVKVYAHRRRSRSSAAEGLR